MTSSCSLAESGASGVGIHNKVRIEIGLVSSPSKCCSPVPVPSSAYYSYVVLLAVKYRNTPYEYKLTDRQGRSQNRRDRERIEGEPLATSADPKKSHDRRSHEPFTARNRKSGLRRKLLGPDGRGQGKSRTGTPDSVLPSSASLQQ